ncbi:hypothetical protein DFH06DRAFT_1339747 [Mycena polygramma]|nr:hypothetical protein DFH06DRAFT_1339747 [Mycena polygramma]
MAPLPNETQEQYLARLVAISPVDVDALDEIDLVARSREKKRIKEEEDRKKAEAERKRKEKEQADADKKKKDDEARKAAKGKDKAKPSEEEKDGEEKGPEPCSSCVRKGEKCTAQTGRAATKSRVSTCAPCAKHKIKCSWNEKGASSGPSSAAIAELQASFELASDESNLHLGDIAGTLDDIYAVLRIQTEAAHPETKLKLQALHRARRERRQAAQEAEDSEPEKRKRKRDEKTEEKSEPRKKTKTGEKEDKGEGSSKSTV